MPRVRLGSFIRTRALLLVGIFVFLIVSFVPQSSQAAVGVNNAVNFQGKLVNTDGTNVPNGTYNLEFKIYQDGDGLAGGAAETLKWTETRLRNNSQGVVVSDGIFQVNLGSVNTALASSVDFNQDTLWFSVNVGNTNATCTPFSSCAPDGEMYPLIRFTATPYALNSSKLSGLTSSQFVQLAQGVQTDASSVSSVFINKTSGTGNILQLQRGGSDIFTIDNAGSTITIGVSGGTNLVSNGALTIKSSGAGSDIIIDGTDQFIVQDTAIFNADGLFVLNETEKLSVSNTSTGSTSVNVQELTVTNNTTSGTQNGIVVRNEAGTGTTESLIVIDNADTDTAVTAGLTIQSASAGITDAIDASDAEIVNAINIGSNNILSGGITISSAELNLLDGHNVALVDVDDAVNTAIIGTGALNAGSIISGFGAIDTGADNITTTGTIAGGTINATTILQHNGTNIITGAGHDVGNVGNITASGTYNTNTFTSSALTFGAAATATIGPASAQALNITANAASTWSTSAGNLTVQAAGTSTLLLDTGGAGVVTVGTAAATVNIGNNTAVNTVNIATAAGNDAVNILTGGGTNTLTIGASTGTNALTIIYGDTLVRSATNSTTAFRINDSANTNLFMVDTTTGNTISNQGTVTINGISSPTTPTLTWTTAGGTLPSNTTYAYRLAAINAAGVSTEAVISSPASITTGNGSNNNQTTLTWSAVSGAASYKVYRSTNGGAWFVNSLTSGTTSLNDTGSSFTWTTAGTPADSSLAGGLVLSGGGGTKFVANNGGSVVLQASASATTDYVLRLPGSQGASGTVLQNDGSGNLSWIGGAGCSSCLAQVPSTTAQNTVTPTASSVVALTVNNTTNATSAVAVIINQTSANNGINLNVTNTAGTQTNGLFINRNGAGGTTTNGLQIANTAGTLTNGILFSGTIVTDIATAAGRGLVVTGNAASSLTTTAGTLTIQGGSGIVSLGTSTSLQANGIITLQSADSTSVSTGAVSLKSGSASVGSNLSSGNIIVDSGTKTGTGTAGSISIGTANAPTVTIGQAAANNTNINFNGVATFKTINDSTTAFQIQGAASNALFVADTTNFDVTVDRGDLYVTNFGTPATPSVAGGANTGGSLTGASGTTYFYKVSALNARGESVGSGETSIAASTFTPHTAPSSAASGSDISDSGNVANGTYRYAYTYVTANGETTIGTTSADVVVDDGLLNNLNQVSVTGITAGPAGTTQRKLYRCTGSGCSSWGLLTTIADNTTTSVTDNTATAGASPPGSNTARTNLNNATVTFTPISGASSYRIYRSTTSGSSYFYQTTTASPFTDTGAAGTSATPPTTSVVGRVGIGTSAPSASLDVQGDALFKGTTNTSAAFLVQNSSGQSHLTVDTANRRVTLSDGQASLGNLFILDTSSAAPTAVAGGMYFDGTQFKCSADGSSFVNCLASSSNLQAAYDASGAPAAITTTAVNKTLLVKAGATFDANNLFQVQNAAGTTIFNVDTVNSKIGTSDSTTVSTSALTIKSGDASVGSNLSSGAVTIDSGTATGTGTAGNISIGTGAYAHNTTVGNSTGSSALNLNSGTGNINLQAAGTGTTGNIQIGSGGSGSSTPDLMVLDNKNTAGDPTGTNGAMYYNSNSSKFRCYENGAWRDCLGSPSAVSATATTTTTSTTDVAVNSITLTPGAGNYIVYFNSSIRHSTEDATITVSIYVNGTQVAASVRNFTQPRNGNFATVSVASHAYVTGVAAGQAIDVRWRTSGATASMFQRSMILEKVGADLAEIYYSKDKSTQPGDVVTVDGSLPAGIKKSTTSYDSKILGIISTQPGKLLDDGSGAGYGIGFPVALSGRVPVKITPGSEPIEAGDYVTSSSDTGKAMKATRAGQAIGKALESWSPDTGKETVMVFVGNEWRDPSYGDRDMAIVQMTKGDFQNLNSSGKATLQDLDVIGIANTQDLVVNGVATVKKLVVEVVAISGDLTVDGTATLERVVVKGNAQFGGDIAIAGNASFQKDINLAAAGQARNAITKKFKTSKDVHIGDVVIGDPANDGQITTTAIASDTKVLGVALTNTAAGQDATVAIGGSVLVKAADPSTANGDLLISSDQEGKTAKAAVTVSGAIIGKALGKPDSSGMVWILVTLN